MYMNSTEVTEMTTNRERESRVGLLEDDEDDDEEESCQTKKEKKKRSICSFDANSTKK